MTYSVWRQTHGRTQPFRVKDVKKEKKFDQELKVSPSVPSAQVFQKYTESSSFSRSSVSGLCKLSYLLRIVHTVQTEPKILHLVTN